MSPRETSLLQALLPKGDLLLLGRQDVLCVFCTLQPPQAFFVLCFPPKVRASLPADVLTLAGDGWWPKRPSRWRKTTGTPRLCFPFSPVGVLTPSPFPFSEVALGLLPRRRHTYDQF